MFLICSVVVVFHIVDQRLIDRVEAAGRGIVAGEIPVAGVFRTAFGQVVETLIDDLQFRLKSGRGQDQCDLAQQIFFAQGVVKKLFDLDILL